MVAVAAFILGIAYQNNKVEIKNRLAPLLGQRQTTSVAPSTRVQEEMMVNRKKALLLQMRHCKMQKRHNDLERRVRRLEQMQMMYMGGGFGQGMAPTYPGNEYQGAAEAQTMPPQFDDSQTIEFSPMEQGQGTIMLRRGN